MAFKDMEHFKKCVIAGLKYKRPVESGFYIFDDGKHVIFDGRTQEEKDKDFVYNHQDPNPPANETPVFIDEDSDDNLLSNDYWELDY